VNLFDDAFQWDAPICSSLVNIDTDRHTERQLWPAYMNSLSYKKPGRSGIGLEIGKGLGLHIGLGLGLGSGLFLGSVRRRRIWYIDFW